MTEAHELTEVEFAPVVERLSKDARKAAETMSTQEVRYLVDRYYQSQDDRKRASSQALAASEGAEPGLAIAWLARQSETLESRIRTMLDIYGAHQPLGIWARSNKGIGPVIAAGLLAHIDITRCPTAGHIWSFAGLDPRVRWKGADETGKILAEELGGKPSEITHEVVVRACSIMRRSVATIERYAKDEDTGRITWTSLCKAIARQPYNAALKVLCWKIGESFVKVSGYEDAFYGKLYVEYRAEEDQRNAAGDYAEQAAAKLRNFNIGKSTEAYKHYSSGKLPPAHLFARAKRRVVKLFLSHYHAVGFEMLHGRPAPRPWAIEFGGHSHFIPPPNWK